MEGQLAEVTCKLGQFLSRFLQATELATIGGVRSLAVLGDGELVAGTFTVSGGFVDLLNTSALVLACLSQRSTPFALCRLHGGILGGNPGSRRG